MLEVKAEKYNIFFLNSWDFLTYMIGGTDPIKNKPLRVTFSVELWRTVSVTYGETRSRLGDSPLKKKHILRFYTVHNLLNCYFMWTADTIHISSQQIYNGEDTYCSHFMSLKVKKIGNLWTKQNSSSRIPLTSLQPSYVPYNAHTIPLPSDSIWSNPAI